MHLDQKILYAAQLFLPDGKKIKSYRDLIEAADKDHAIIVGCGEPFDPTTVPYDLLEAYLHGGGREGLKKVKAQLKQKQKIAAQEKADTVRVSPRPAFSLRIRFSLAGALTRCARGAWRAGALGGARHPPQLGRRRHRAGRRGDGECGG